MSIDKIWLPYVYLLTHKFSQKFYIGMRSANKVPAELDLGILYFSSSKIIKNNFQDYNCQIIACFQDWESAFLFENALIKENWKNPNILNRHYQDNINTFSMKGAKRPDLAKLNELKRKPKENRLYTCPRCDKLFIREEFKHHKLKIGIFCSRSCSSKRPNKNKGKPLPYIDGRSAWNKGIQNTLSSDNGKRGATKLSATVTGRKRKYLEDGSWIWYYPKGVKDCLDNKVQSSENSILLN